MADKNFGVRGINFISDPGTSTISIASSTITYAESLNLNAPTVAISTDVSIGGRIVSNVVVSDSYSVGIGTTVLTQKLNVSGNANISGIVSATGFVGSGVSLTGLLTNQSSGINTEVYHYLLVTPQTSGTISSISPSYNYIIFNPSAKYLGIGTDSPAAGLDVNGTGRFASSVTAPSFLGTATTASSLSASASVNTTGIITATGGFNIGIQSGGIDITTGVITAINFVGSGNTFSYNSTTKVIDVTISGGSGGISSVSISTNTTNQNQYIPYTTSFGSTTGFGATTLLVYNPSSGNLGIGTTNPTSKLHVQGDVSISGVTTSGGIVVTTGNVYKVGVDTVLNSTTLGTGVTISSLTSVGTLNQLNVSTSGITTVGFITATNLQVSGVTTSGGIVVTTGNDYKINSTSVLNSTTLGTGVVNSSLTSVGTLNQLNVSTSGITTVGFITATNLQVSGVTTSGGIVVTTGNVYKVGVDTVLNSTTLGTGVTISSLTSVGTLNQLNVSTSGITTLGVVTSGNIYSTGIITATTFSTGISTQNVGFTTGIISGPNTIFINPHQIGVSTGTVRILGNLQVDGTTVTTAQATIQSSSKTIGVAVSETDNIVLDGAGITIGSTSIQKTFLWNYGSESLKSSENLNVALGKVYQINDSAVLSSTTLANSVTTAAGLTTVGTLQQLVVSSNTSTDAVRITQTGSGNALIVEDESTPDGTAFIVSSDGSIGIGTTIPAYKLTITNNALPTLGLTNAIADFTGSVDGYTQLNIRNSLAGASASSDLIATADAGSDTTNYIDLGINNSAFSSGSWTVNGALDGYLYTSDGSLSIGIATNNTAKYLSFFAGGLLAANEQVRINQTGVGIGTTNVTSKLTVVGDVRITGVSTLGVTTATNLTSQQLNVSGVTTSGGVNVTTGNDYKINSTSVLNSTTLGTGVVNSSLTSVGTLNQLNVSASGITTVGFITATNLQVSGISTLGGVNVTTGNDYKINSTSVLNSTTLGTGVINSSLTSVGTLNQLNVSGVSTLGVTTATNLTSQQLNVSGITTVGFLTASNIFVSGVTTSTDFDSLSDFNLKTNIQQIDDSLAKVIQIRGVTFDWKETNRSSAGVIAQEVEKVLPELVNGEEIKTVNYNGVIGALVEAVKELKAENDILKERLDEVYKKVFG
jgi:hypothetical protein